MDAPVAISYIVLFILKYIKTKNILTFDFVNIFMIMLHIQYVPQATVVHI